LGAHNITDLSEEGHLVVESTQFVVHEEYVAFLSRNNLALVILPEPVSGPSEKTKLVFVCVLNLINLGQISKPSVCQVAPPSDRLWKVRRPP